MHFAYKFSCFNKKHLALYFIVFLIGCSSVSIGKIQTTCESMYSSFQQVISCTKDSLRAQRPNAFNFAEVKFYFLKADELVDAINRGQITEIQAKVQLQQVYLNLKASSDAQSQAAMNTMLQLQQIQNQQRPVNTNCTTFGSSVNCRSY